MPADPKCIPNKWDSDMLRPGDKGVKITQAPVTDEEAKVVPDYLIYEYEDEEDEEDGGAAEQGLD